MSKNNMYTPIKTKITGIEKSFKIYSQKLTFPGEGKPGNCPPNCEQTGASILFLENDINLSTFSTMEVSNFCNPEVQKGIFHLKAVSTFSITCRAPSEAAGLNANSTFVEELKKKCFHCHRRLFKIVKLSTIGLWIYCYTFKVV